MNIIATMMDGFDFDGLEGCTCAATCTCAGCWVGGLALLASGGLGFAGTTFAVAWAFFSVPVLLFVPSEEDATWGAV